MRMLALGLLLASFAFCLGLLLSCHSQTQGKGIMVDYTEQQTSYTRD